MQINKYVSKTIWLYIIMIVVFTYAIAYYINLQQQQEREPFISKIRESYRSSMRGTRNIVRDIYKRGYLYASKMLRM